MKSADAFEQFFITASGMPVSFTWSGDADNDVEAWWFDDAGYEYSGMFPEQDVVLDQGFFTAIDDEGEKFQFRAWVPATAN